MVIVTWALRYIPRHPPQPLLPPLPAAPIEKKSLPGKPPNYLLIDIDTLSADHVGALRDGKPVTPVIDRLAAHGLRFTQAISQSGWTLPAVSSLLTGALPVPMRLRDGIMPWKTNGAQDVAGILGIYGYQTAAFWQKTLAGGIIGDATKFFGLSSTQNTSLPTEELRSWIGTTSEPFFAFAHEIDLNFPNAMPGPYVFDDPAWPADATSYLNVYQDLVSEIGEDRAKAAVVAHYDSVMYNYDAAIGRVLEALDQRGMTDHTVVIVTSNHGQDFFQHTLIDHGLLYDTNLRIPLVLMDPARSEQGILVSEMVQLVDVVPTMLQRSGIPVAASMVGQSLLPPPGTTGSTYEVRPVFSLVDECNASIRTPTYKLIVRDRRSRWDATAPSDDAALKSVPLSAYAQEHGIRNLPVCSKVPAMGAAEKRGLTTADDLVIELYALTEDPAEVHNLAQAQEAVVTQMLPVLLQTMASQREAGEGASKNVMTPAQVKQIQQQGYWGLVDDGKPPPP